MGCGKKPSKMELRACNISNDRNGKIKYDWLTKIESGNVYKTHRENVNRFGFIASIRPIGFKSLAFGLSYQGQSAIFSKNDKSWQFYDILLP